MYRKEYVIYLILVAIFIFLLLKIDVKLLIMSIILLLAYVDYENKYIENINEENIYEHRGNDNKIINFYTNPIHAHFGDHIFMTFYFSKIKLISSFIFFLF